MPNNNKKIDFYYRDETSGINGFDIIYRKFSLKLDFDAGGVAAMQSLIAALIVCGINSQEEILDYVSDITGLHSEDRVRMVLMEGENIHWHRLRDGTYTPTVQH